MQTMRALADLVRDLLAGDPVAWTFVGVIVLFAVVLLLWGMKILRDKRRQDEEHQKRQRRAAGKKL